MANSLTIAISKGRILEESLPLLEKVGIIPDENPEQSRKLILGTSQADVKLIIIRATDVPTYVEYGGADVGIAGKDILLEHDSSQLYEPLDLGIARCRLMLAELVQKRTSNGRLRVATKYTRTTRQYFTELGTQVEIIKLYGSMELAPVLGLADKIVDLVDTGNTLKANGLRATETICDISSRLVVNKAAMKIKRGQIKDLIASLEKIV